MNGALTKTIRDAAAQRVTRVAIYLRQSLDANDDRAAVLRQLRACERWCAERSTPSVAYEVVKIYEDNDTSATKSRRARKDFTAMLAGAKAGEFDLIVSYHLDRLTRTIRDLLPLLELATKLNIGTTTVSGDIDLASDMGRLVAGILAVVANAEVDRKAARQILANQQRAEVGDPHIGGARPIGYDRCERSKDEQHLPKIVIREDEAKHIRAAYQNLLAGRSCSAIARDLNAAGVRTTKRNTKRQGLFSHNAVVDVLTNPLYAGKKVYRDEIVRDGNWEPLVDETTWRSAVAILKDPSRRTNHNAGGTRRWIGSGIYRCGVCAANGVEETVVATYRESGVRVYSAAIACTRRGWRTRLIGTS
jgi:site-specific DNA recombinase